MIFSKYEKVLLVAPNIFSVQLLTNNTHIKHITSAGRVFPCIHELGPNIIVFDYDYLSNDMEKILRRIRTNPYYNKIKICCFKNTAERKIDGFLKALGVNHVIYNHQFHNPTKTTINEIKSILEPAVTDLMLKAFC